MYVYTQHHFSTRDSLAPQITLAISKDTFGGHSAGEKGGGDTEGLVMEARGAAEPPTRAHSAAGLQRVICSRQSRGWETLTWRWEEQPENSAHVWGRSAWTGLRGSPRCNTNWKTSTFWKIHTSGWHCQQTGIRMCSSMCPYLHVVRRRPSAGKSGVGGDEGPFPQTQSHWD